MSTQIISFSYSWNNKLDCSAFTTIRIHQPSKYVVGSIYEVNLKGKLHGRYKILDIKHFKLSQINEFVARLDTGYSKEECTSIIKKMYPKVNFETKLLSLILLSSDL